jgi:hypothetical protein
MLSGLLDPPKGGTPNAATSLRRAGAEKVSKTVGRRQPKIRLRPMIPKHQSAPGGA